MFWGVIPLILIYGLISGNETLDINLGDTYFVFEFYFILIPLCLYLYLVGLGYYLSYHSDKFKPLNFLTLIHVILTLTGLLILSFVPQFSGVNPNESLRGLGILGFAVAQIILLFNLTISIFKR